MNRFARMLRKPVDPVPLRLAVCGALVATLLVSGHIWADPKGPQSSDKQVALSVVRLLREHLSKMPLDDEISKRTFGSILKTLDPLKIYFVQADIDEFAKDETNLDDMLKKGDVSFIYKVFHRLLERIDERVVLVDELLKIEPDFTLDEEIVVDPKQAKYAADDAEMREKWRKLIKYELLLKKLDAQDEEARQKKLDEAKQNEAKPEEQNSDAKPTSEKASEKKAAQKTPQELISHKYHGIAKLRHQMNSDDLLELYLNALAMSFDPHTDFMSASSNDQFESRMSLHYDGIGAMLGSDYGTTKITELVPGGAAAKDGRLKPGDLLLGVGQDREGDMVDVADMNNNDIVKLIRGKAGSIVRLKVNPAAGGDPKVIDITRASIELKDSEARGEIVEIAVDESAEKPAGDAPAADRKTFKIGVIDLPSFYMDMNAQRLGLSTFRSTSRDLEKILHDFTEKKVDAVVLDLRRNGGGSLLEAVKTTGLFIDQGPVVQVKDSKGKLESPGRHRPRRGLGWSADGAAKQNERQRQRSFCRRHSRLWPRPDRGGSHLARQRPGTNDDRHQQSAVRRIWQCAFAGGAENHDPAVLPSRRREHAKPRSAFRRGAAVNYFLSARGRVGFRLCDEVRSGSSSCLHQHAHGRYRPHYKTENALGGPSGKIGRVSEGPKKNRSVSAVPRTQIRFVKRAKVEGGTGRAERRTGRGKANRSTRRLDPAGRRPRLLLQRSTGGNSRFTATGQNAGGELTRRRIDRRDLNGR